MKRHQAWKN
uniref:Uncharacterized protein n=1 Tax=Salix viminalis TaxID=40686 RepID=A0A6N2L465_SALVM